MWKCWCSKRVEVEIKPEIDRKKSIGENTFKFLDYFIHKITFGKKHDNIKIYENFRKKIISVENLMQIYLKMNNLLDPSRKISKINSK